MAFLIQKFHKFKIYSISLAALSAEDPELNNFDFKHNLIAGKRSEIKLVLNDELIPETESKLKLTKLLTIVNKMHRPISLEEGLISNSKKSFDSNQARFVLFEYIFKRLYRNSS